LPPPSIMSNSSIGIGSPFIGVGGESRVLGVSDALVL
jgi:hypothetical protein